MEPWRWAWREGFQPGLTTAQLNALKVALSDDSPRLMQGATTLPPPLRYFTDWRVKSACLAAFCGIEDGRTVGEVEEFFALACFEANKRLGEHADCRHLTNWWDDTPRDEARAAMLAEVELELANREALCS